MCLTPTAIPNPNFGRRDSLAYLVDTKSRFLNVPCGHCTECIYMRQSAVVQRCEAESLDNHLFYCTLSYNNESLPILYTSTGVPIRYADMRDFVLCMKRLRKHDDFDRPIRYFVVSELGEKKGRPHFHAILFVPKRKGDDAVTIMQLESWLFDNLLAEWRRNYGSTRSPVYKPLCTYVRRWIRGELKTNYDCHYLNPRSSENGVSDVAFYVSKYMLKPSDRQKRLQQALKLNLCPSEYEDVWKVVKTRFHASTNFGCSSTIQKEYVRDCIELSKVSGKSPQFLSECGFSYPLARYYQRKGDIWTLPDADFFLKAREQVPGDAICIDERPGDLKSRRFEKLKKMQRQVSFNDLMSTDLDELN